MNFQAIQKYSGYGFGVAGVVMLIMAADLTTRPDVPTAPTAIVLTAAIVNLSVGIVFTFENHISPKR